MNRRRLLQRLLRGSRNVAFADLVNLAEGFGFRQVRVRGSHHMLSHPDVPELLNLQPAGKQAKPYQIEQLLKLVEEYRMTLRN